MKCPEQVQTMGPQPTCSLGMNRFLLKWMSTLKPQCASVSMQLQWELNSQLQPRMSSRHTASYPLRLMTVPISEMWNKAFNLRTPKMVTTGLHQMSKSPVHLLPKALGDWLRALGRDTGDRGWGWSTVWSSLGFCFESVHCPAHSPQHSHRQWRGVTAGAVLCLHASHFQEQYHLGK